MVEVAIIIGATCCIPLVGAAINLPSVLLRRRMTKRVRSIRHA